MRKIVDDVNNMLESATNDINSRKYMRGIAKLIFMSLVGACVVLCVIWLCTLVYKYIDYIIIVIGGIACVIVFFRSLVTKKPDSSKEVPKPVQQSTVYYDPITLENTYKILRSNICNVIGEIHDIIKVRKPMSLGQMDAPTHYDIVANTPIYHLLVAKNGEGMDEYTLLGILQSAIEQKLNNNEFDGISQRVFFYNGQAYPAIMVDSVRTCNGMIQINVVIANAYYCKYREQRIYDSMNVTGYDEIQDKEF